MFEKSQKNILFDLPGLQIASLEDATFSTGATLFYFPHGGAAQVDIRGGSAATSETSLLTPGSYAHLIDGVVFAGGSTMGLAAADGVREALFKSRGDKAGHFDNIPSVPAAVVYDFSTRIHAGQNPLVYPDRQMGMDLMKHLSANTFRAGRAGAGVTTTANKMSQKVWGGQGLAQRDLGFGKVISAVILNPAGNLAMSGLKPIEISGTNAAPPKTNTTLSITVTDIPLSENELQRLGVMVHTSMARMIFPFQSYSDGDTHFVVSTQRQALNESQKSGDRLARELFNKLSLEAAEAMKDAITLAATIANT